MSEPNLGQGQKEELDLLWNSASCEVSKFGGEIGEGPDQKSKKEIV
jgi:hypothetical protein